MTLSDEPMKTAIGPASEKWGWFVALGVLLLILGVIALGNLFVATIASVYFIGWLMLLAGVIEIVHAFGVKTWGRFFYWFLAGLIYAIAGFFAFYNPLLASAVLTLLLAAALLATGLLRIWIGIKTWSRSGSGWLVTAGVVTAIAGLLIAFQWPVNSVWVLGLFLAIDLTFQGWALIALGLALRKTGQAQA